MPLTIKKKEVLTTIFYLNNFIKSDINGAEKSTAY